jgi:hypothetical protein
MDVQETIDCLQLLLDSVILKDNDPKFTILNNVKPSSFCWVIDEAMTILRRDTMIIKDDD